MKKTTLLTYPIIAILLIIAIVIGPQISTTNQPENQEIIKAEVTKVIQESTDAQNQTQTLEVKTADKTFTITNDESFQTSPRTFEEGDKVILTHVIDQNYYYILDYNRTNTLLILFLIFVATVLLITGLQGVGALIGMVLSFIIIFKLVLPQILTGVSPVLAAITGAVFIIPITFYSSHGANKKTTIAVFSTLVTLILAGLLAHIFANIGNLTGLASEQTSYLTPETAANINFQGLVLAGMIISMLGILDDITISQASIVNQLRAAKPKISFRELFGRAMHVGRDHISSLVNTLILVYAGASLPMLLLFLDRAQSLSMVINYEFLSEEIIRTLIGSIALIFAVPITTLLAALFIKKASVEESSGHRPH